MHHLIKTYSRLHISKLYFKLLLNEAIGILNNYNKPFKFQFYVLQLFMK